MTQINRIPQGYLDFLQAQTGGKTPPEVADAVIPSIDLDELYAQHLHAAYQANVLTGLGTTTVVTVPEGESWMLRGIGTFVTLASNLDEDSLQFSLSRHPRTIPGSALFPEANIWVTPTIRVANNGDQLANAILFPKPYLMPAGMRITAERTEFAGGPRTTNFQLSVDVYRF